MMSTKFGTSARTPPCEPQHRNPPNPAPDAHPAHETGDLHPATTSETVKRDLTITAHSRLSDSSDPPRRSPIMVSAKGTRPGPTVVRRVVPAMAVGRQPSRDQHLDLYDVRGGVGHGPLLNLSIWHLLEESAPPAAAESRGSVGWAVRWMGAVADAMDELSHLCQRDARTITYSCASRWRRRGSALAANQRR